VVGIGNPDRGDDAAGRLVARRLRAALSPGAVVLEQSGDAAQLVEVMAGHDIVVVVDAVQSGIAQPGHLHRIEAGASPLPSTFRAVSTHGFGMGEGIELARALGKLSAKVIVYGIEAGAFTPGEAPTPAVAAGIEQATAAILEELRNETTTGAPN
jgi:hydrogenase maturation protease